MMFAVAGATVIHLATSKSTLCYRIDAQAADLVAYAGRWVSTAVPHAGKPLCKLCLRSWTRDVRELTVLVAMIRDEAARGAS